MANNTETYIRGMEAINNFYVMLYQAMKSAMPTAQVSKTGAYVWRGYQINAFEGLAPNLYFCEIYPGNPLGVGISRERIDDLAHLPPDAPLSLDINIDRLRTFTCDKLVFEESYQDPSHKPIDKYEKVFAIKTGNFYYPFRVSLNLYQSRFFIMNTTEQFMMLKNFVSYASQQALIWNQSEARTRVTNPEYLRGKNSEYQPVEKKFFDHVSMDFLFVWQQQDTLFDLLEILLWEHVPTILKKEIEWIRKNANIFNFDFRGLRLKFKHGTNEDAADFLWAVYFDKPEILGCFTMDDKKVINTLNLKDNNFFDLNEEDKAKKLVGFIQKSLKT
jgi:hypothetical protein